jgi:hypothetical protein
MSDLGNELNQQILELCQQGQKLAAIKLLKEQTGLELKECKDYVEKLAAANGIVPKSGCFVATACYGSYDAPEVVVLRHYRDNTLLQTDLGRLFVKFYYRVSPYIAAKIATSDSAKNAIRKYILSPIVRKIRQNE